MNQRLIVCITVVLEINSNDSSNSIKLFFRNVIQIYMQSIFNLNREFYVKSFHKFVSVMKTSYDCIFKIMKLLYEVFEINNHWFFIYHKHYIEKFVMIKSTYDSCLFHNIKSFDLIDFQTDDTLIFVNNDFVIKKIKLSKQLTSWSKNANVLALQIRSNLTIWKSNFRKMKQSSSNMHHM